MSGGLINIVHVFPTDSFRRYRVSISHFLDELSQVQCYFSSDFYRPPDILVGKLRFYRDSFFLSFIFFRHLPTELAERNSTKNRPYARKWVRFEPIDVSTSFVVEGN